MRTQMRVERVADRVGAHSLARSKCATWPSAWTPASVRPAPCTMTFSPENASIAVMIARCTDGELSWYCQPANGAPSYSTMIL